MQCHPAEGHAVDLWGGTVPKLLRKFKRWKLAIFFRVKILSCIPALYAESIWRLSILIWWPGQNSYFDSTNSVGFRVGLHVKHVETHFPSCKQNRFQENTTSVLTSKCPIKFNVDIFTIVTNTGNFYITFSVQIHSNTQCWWCKVSVIIQQNSIPILFSSQSFSAVKSMIPLNVSVQETGFIWWH